MNTKSDKKLATDVLLASLAEDNGIDPSNKKKRKDRRTGGKTMFVGAPGEGAILQTIDSSRNQAESQVKD
jgi:hypothetical protein